MSDIRSPWNSLEIAKLFLEFLTPFTMLWLGYLVSKLTQGVQRAQWANQKVIEKRIAVFDEVAPMLNDIYCYFRFVGNWKELSPPDIIEHKRKLDKRLNVYSPLFSSQFMDEYNNFIHLCFTTFSGPTHDATLRTPIEKGGDKRKKPFGRRWCADWDDLFAPEADHTDLEKIKKAYETLMALFADELAIGLTSAHAANRARNIIAT